MLGRVALLCALLTVSAADAAERYRAPRTSFGAPSLEGDWTSRSMTHLQRPKEFTALVAYIQTLGRAKDWRPDHDYER